MASITSWNRLEPRLRSTEIKQGLQARVRDPLWLLARQWQMGEFQAEDAGTPIAARLRGETSRLTRYHAGPLDGTSVTGHPYDGRTPLETLVEREPLTRAGAVFHPARAAEAGLHFLRLLAAHGAGRYRDAYRAAYALQVPDDATRDDDGARYLSVMAGRAVDGHQLYGDLARGLRPQDGTAGLPETPAIEPGDQTAVQNAAEAFLTWYEQRYSEPEEDTAAWVADRMEYAFAVAAPAAAGEVVLAAAEYHGGKLDWYHLNHQSGASLGIDGTDAQPAPFVRTVIPAPVSFQGMPDARWWTFEDAEVDLGSLEAGAEDLGRMLLLQFALNYSDDWFLLPVEMEVGSLVQMHSLVVTDTFGARTLVQPYGAVDGPAGAWRMFAHSVSGDGTAVPAGDRLFLPPVLGAGLLGRPVEEIHFLRDEMANMAWAVERKVENARGRAYDRHEHYLATRPDPSELVRAAPGDANLIYTLATEVPEHWIPLVPTLDPATAAMRLRRAKMLLHRGRELHELQPEGRILEPETDLRLHEEEVPRAGAHVTRAYQYTRWTDGSAYLWMGRRKRPGRGEGWSGLRYDFIESVV